MGQIHFNTVYEGGGTYEGSVTTDISDAIHDAVLRGVTECGQYDIDVAGYGQWNDPEVEVEVSGTVYVHVDAETLIENDVEDQGYDAFEMEITEYEVCPDRYGEVEINYTVKINREVEHEQTTDFDEFVDDCKAILANIPFGGDVHAKVLRVLRLALGSEFLEQLEA